MSESRKATLEGRRVASEAEDIPETPAVSSDVEAEAGGPTQASPGSGDGGAEAGGNDAAADRKGARSVRDDAGPAADGSDGSDGEGPIVVSPSVYRRLTSGVPGFAMAMLCCLVIVGMVLLVTPRRNLNAMPQVDYHADLTGLVTVAPFTVQAPVGLDPKWYPTSSRLTGRNGGPIGWHLGFYTPQKQYAALEESDERPDGTAGFVARMTSQGTPQGSMRMGGAVWDKTFRKDKNQRSLVLRSPGVTLVVTGTASYEELAALAGSLRPQPKPSPAASAPSR